MEILILGVLLVALMAYVSTRIKKSAAQAFEREAVETEDFRIVKPEGFLNLLSRDSENAFEAYSKDFGAADAEEYRKAVVKIYVTGDGQSEDLPAESEETEKGVVIQTFRKVLRNSEKSYTLEISVLKDYRDEYLDKINEMLGSFALKR